MGNPFFGQGNREALEQVKGLRLAKITSVNVDDMVAEIEFLEESSGKTRVPIPMPMSYPGGGIFSIPKKGAIVLVGIRAMQMPMIISFYPFNVFSPDSNYAIMKQVFGMPDELSEGDVFLRAASQFAKCATCFVISSIAAWEAKLDPTTLVELCPNCEAPAHTVDESGKIASLNKIQLGMTLHMRSDGKLFFQGDNMSDRGEGDTQRLIKGVIDGVTGDVTLTDANDIVVDANGNSSLTCSKATTVALNGIEESSDSRVENVTLDSIENVLNKTIDADDTVLITAETITARAAGIMDRSSGNLIESVDEDHTYVSGSLSAATSGNRTWVVGSVAIPADDFETIYGSTTVIIGGSVGETITGGVTMTIGGAQAVTVTGASSTTFSGGRTLVITGASTTTVTGAYSMSATGVVTLSSVAAMNISGATVVLNSGTLGVARLNDTTLSSAASDPVFWLFYNNLVAFLTTFAADSTPFAASQAAAAIAVASATASITAKISSASTTVKAGT